jgi:hypothetical protein
MTMTMATLYQAMHLTGVAFGVANPPLQCIVLGRSMGMVIRRRSIAPRRSTSAVFMAVDFTVVEEGIADGRINAFLRFEDQRLLLCWRRVDSTAGAMQNARHRDRLPDERRAWG